MSRRTGYVIAVDQGTGSTKAIALDHAGDVVAHESVPTGQTFPQPGWAEQDPHEIIDSVRTALSRLCTRLDQPVAAVGVSSQRESVLLWDSRTGQPVSPLISWQDRRTAELAARLKVHDRAVRDTSGLPISPMFSALKLNWLVGAADGTADVTAGTVDAWILACLTGERRIEQGNASRTQLLELSNARWSPALLDIFDIPVSVLPDVVPSNLPSSPIRGIDGLEGVRITGVLADSHAAFYAHGAFMQPSVKVTYGTGSSVLGIGDGRSTPAPAGLVSTIAWAAPETVYAFEGNVLSTGSTLTWLARLLRLTPDELAMAASQAPSHCGVDLVPAFAGLGAPWWDEGAAGVITGLTFDTDTDVIARAALESIVLQVEDVLAAADLPGDAPILADGGPTGNPFLMQLQADFSQRTVHRADTAELSAVGAAHLAGLTAGFWTDDELAGLPRPRTVFTPAMDTGEAGTRREQWHAAVAMSRLHPAASTTAKEHP
ncbi:FGGY family carbohydrate kinase [Phytoactinopolyspora endophytica]|uniref:FGGY family carbohydrate kinase n=1 Tax=Phytoactinopolyspora endophytica TaxID=1642495 RepID=UPI00101CBCBC|nr:FGGY family carbohydrate kinase [Phytoactinopolyspora endophytica]